MNLIKRIQDILTKPKETWAEIEAEPATTASLFTQYLMILAAIPAVCSFVSLALIGVGGFGIHVRMPIGTALVNMVALYLISLAGMYAISLVINALAPTFDGIQNPVNALKLVAYSSTATLVAGVFNLLPGVAAGLLLFVGSLYSIYLLYIGLPITMKNPPEKSVAYTFIIAVCSLVIWVVAGILNAVLFAGSMLPGSQITGYGGNSIRIETPQGTVNLGTDQINAMAKKMEEARAKMEQAQKSSNAQAANAAAGAGSAAATALGGDSAPQGTVAAQAIKAALPEQLGDLKRTAFEISDGTAIGVSSIHASATYNHDGKSANLSITDIGNMSSGLAALAGLGAGERETNETAEKTWQSNGRTLQEKYAKDGSRAEVRAVLKNGVIVYLEGQGIAIGDLRALMNRVDLNSLESLPRTPKS